MGCLLDNLRVFGINADHWTTTVQDEGEWHKTVEQGAERFMTKLIAADKVKAFFFSFHLTYSRWTSSLPSCLWSQRIFPSLPGLRLTFFLSRCKFSTLTTRQPMVEFYLLTFPRFPLRKKEHKFYLGKNRTHDFRTSRCAAYLLDHSGDELLDSTYSSLPERDGTDQGDDIPK